MLIIYLRDRTLVSQLAKPIKMLSLTTATAFFVGVVSLQPSLAAKDLPVVDSSALGKNMDLPWSQAVKVNDPFEGNYLGVFDRNYFFKRFLNNNVKFEVLSLWSRKSIRFLLAYRDRDCFHTGLPIYTPIYTPINNCSISTNTQNVSKLFIKIGEQVFQLNGQNNIFPVNQELAAALKASPNQNISVRLLTESGETIDSEIGRGTVNAWKDIY